MEQKRHIISLLVENEFGSLSQIAGLFSARGYNIDCLNVAPTNDESISRMTIVTFCSDQKILQLMKLLEKLVDVVNVKDLTEETHIEREMLLMKLKCNKGQRNELKRLTDIFRARIIDVSDTTYTIELTGVAEKIIAFMNSLGKIKIVEMVRSGALGISRGAEGLQSKE
ncbi:MAG: acetolactate synthase small subunit [Pseudomonadota bacterium]|nr:acetolactate synthase small subunit [Pseudomonadota bacterium]MEC8996588.1 acetolactate synthase small subunit [Pseudomonadota bacterium]MED5275150.1 acetolactate synthase small subunit [Pseudomonadota bacterium]MED5430358.1 acetolactate synthase small subunit [Pseudomonadota bacterium]|tara:strand:+ start:7033 stop:7539 length:507 start_codon:yes stop_codon:yes gene_type:complete